MTDSPDEQRWSLQGQLVGQWAAEFTSAWRKAHVAGDIRTCIVELIESEIMSHGAEFIASDVYTKHLLQNLRGDLERSRVKEKHSDGGNRS